MARANDPQTRAAAKQEKKLAAHTDLYDRTWMRYKCCEFCGREICVNNYEDRKSRTPKFMGKVICPWCTPLSPLTGAVINRAKYRMAMAMIITEKLAKTDVGCLRGGLIEDCKCLVCSMRKIAEMEM